MLYSPILSISRLIVMIPWILFISTIHLIFSLVSKKSFFYFFRIFFKGIVSIIGIKIKISGVPLYNHQKLIYQLLLNDHMIYRTRLNRNGGSGQVHTFGFNHYFNSNVRAMVEYSYGDYGTDDSQTRASSEISAIQARLHLKY